MMKNCAIRFWKHWRGKKGILTKGGIKLRKVFADDELISQVEAAIMDAGYETSLIPDEEHGLSEIEISLESGGSRFA